MKIENKILKHFYGKAYKDSFYDEDREELRIKFGINVKEVSEWANTK